MWCWMLLCGCETHQLTLFHGSLLHLLSNPKLWRSKLIKYLQGLCKSWLCNRTQCITAGGKRSSSCYRGTKNQCQVSSLCVDSAGALESCGFCSLGPAFQPVTPEFSGVLWPVSCFGDGIDVLRSAVAMAVCDCKGLGWAVICVSQIISKR